MQVNIFYLNRDPFCQGFSFVTVSFTAAMSLAGASPKRTGPCTQAVAGSGCAQE